MGLVQRDDTLDGEEFGIGERYGFEHVTPSDAPSADATLAGQRRAGLLPCSPTCPMNERHSTMSTTRMS